MNKLYRLFASPVIALLFLLLFALAMAIATFVENDFGTATAWKVIYNAWWFEVLMLGLGICFVANIFKYKLLQPAKWALLLFHLAFIVILIGASITRYYSYGGIMRIREGQSSNIIISDDNYLHVHVTSNGKTKTYRRAIDFSPISDNSFVLDGDIEGKTFSVSYGEFIADAIPEIQSDSLNGKALLELVVSSGNGRQTVFLEKGEIESIGAHQHKIGFEVNEPNVVTISQGNDGELYIQSPRDLSACDGHRNSLNTQ